MEGTYLGFSECLFSPDLYIAQLFVMLVGSQFTLVLEGVDFILERLYPRAQVFIPNV